MGPNALVSSNKIGRYQIVREIARSNDIVYEAVDPAMGRRVAVKELLMPPNLVGAQKRERIERFYREAKAAGTLTHPNIVTVYEVGEDQGRHFIAMEYLEGHSLRDQLQMAGLVSVPEALRVAIAIGEALHYAHEHGVIHRDVKPDNVHLLPDGRVKLTDFGIARLMFESSLTANGQVFGTPSYMSPEQVAGKHLDARSDLFSLAVMLYEMVAGRKPFSGDSVITITYNIMNLQPAALTGVPQVVDRIVARGMAKDPSLRFRSAAEMVEELRRAQASLNGAGRPGGYSAPTTAAQRPAAVAAPSGHPPVGPPRPSTAGASPPRASAAASSSSSGTANPFAHLQPDDLWFPRQKRQRPTLGPGARAALANLAIYAIIAAIMGFLIWSTITAYDAVRGAGKRKEAIAVGQQGQRSFNANRFDDAARQFQRAWQLDPNSDAGRIARENSAIAAINEGYRHQRAFRYTDAARWFQNARQYDPDYPGSYDPLAQLAYNQGQGDMDRADALWQKAIELWSRRTTKGPTAPARAEAAKRLEEVQRNAATAWLSRGDLLKQVGRTAEAQRAWTRAMQVGAGTELAVQAQQRMGSSWGGGGY